MVGGQADDGVLQLSGLLQPLQQVLQGLVQLHLAGQIGPGVLAHVLVAHLIPVLGGHGVAQEGVVHMSADRQIVGVEGALQAVVGEGGLHHLRVGFRPCVGVQLQPVAYALVVVAQVGVGLVPVVVGPK